MPRIQRTPRKFSAGSSYSPKLSPNVWKSPRTSLDSLCLCSIKKAGHVSKRDLQNFTPASSADSPGTLPQGPGGFRELLHELGRLGPIAHTMIYRDSRLHAERPAVFLTPAFSPDSPGTLPAFA